MSSTPQRADEQTELIALLEQTAKAYLDMLASVPESAAGVKLTDECWSILQVAEHVAAVEQRMLRGLQMVPERTAAPEYDRDAKIAGAVKSRERKLQAPEMVLPKGRWLTLADCAEAFRTGRAKTIEYVRTAENLRGKAFPHPLLGEIDGWQALLVMAHHPERHAGQIEEIKQSAGYAAATR